MKVYLIIETLRVKASPSNLCGGTASRSLCCWPQSLCFWWDIDDRKLKIFRQTSRKNAPVLIVNLLFSQWVLLLSSFFQKIMIKKFWNVFLEIWYPSKYKAVWLILQMKASIIFDWLLKLLLRLDVENLDKLRLKKWVWPLFSEMYWW